MNELKRIVNYKLSIFYIVLLFLNGIMLIYTNKADGPVSKAFDNMINRANSVKTENMTYREAMIKGVASYMEDNGINRENISKADGTARKLALEKAEQLDGHKENINILIGNYTNILSTDLMAEESSERYMVLKSRYDLHALKNENPKLSNGIWLEKLFEYNYIQFFVLILICSSVYSFFNEKKTGLFLIVNSSANGRKKLKVKRLIILMIESVVISLSFYLESMIILLNIHGGIKGINDLALLDNGFLLTSMDFTRIQFVIFLMLVSALFAFICGVMLWLLLSLFSNMNIGLEFFIILMGLEIIIYKLVNPKSVIRFLHYINTYYLLFPHYAVKYSNWGYGTFVYRELTVIMVVLSLMACFFAGVIVLNKRFNYSYGKINFIERTAGSIHELNMRFLTRLPNFFKEIYKVLISQKNIVILCVLLLIVMKIEVEPRHIYTMHESYMLGYYNEAQGLSYGAELESAIEKIESEFLQGEENIVDDEAIVKERNELKKNFFSEMYDNAEYLRKQMDYGNKAVCIAPYEYDDAFGIKQKENQMFLALINILAVIFISSSCFAYESKNGVDKLAFSSKKRRKWIVCKLKTNCLIIAVFMLASYGTYYYKLANTYDISNMSVPVKSFKMFEMLPINPTLAGWNIINLLGIYVGLVVISFLITVVSFRVTHLYCTLVGMIVVIPQFIYMAGIEFMENLSIGKYIALMPLLNENNMQIYYLFMIIALVGATVLYRVFRGKGWIKT